MGSSALSPDVLTVSELTERIRFQLRNSFGGVTVRGEVSNFRRQASGHCYFSLKDRGAQLSVVLFRGQALRVRVDLADGMEVEVGGELDVYPPRGNYQLIARFITEDGVGRLRAEFDRLKAKLEAEGLFDRERKRSLPLLPGTVGIVTSPTGAAFRDMVSVFRRRKWNGRILLFPSAVQGGEAAGEIERAIARANRLGQCDVLIIGRGGGSLEDLWPFNEEGVVRAVGRSGLPVISAVGHETDFVLSDFVADRRAETPTAAAEILTSGFIEQRNRLEHASKGLRVAIQQGMVRLRDRVAAMHRTLQAHSPGYHLRTETQKVDAMAARLQRELDRYLGGKRDQQQQLADQFHRVSPASRLKELEQSLLPIGVAMDRAVRLRFAKLGEDCRFLGSRIRATSLESTLRRGFAMVRRPDGEVVMSANHLEAEDPLTVSFKDGDRMVRVTS